MMMKVRRPNTKINNSKDIYLKESYYIMTIPKIPTDNLYKFICISSLISILVIVIGFSYYIHLLTIEVMKTTDSIRMTSILVDEIKEKKIEYDLKKEILLEHYFKTEKFDNITDSIYSSHIDLLLKTMIFKLKLENKLNNKELVLLEEFNKLEKEVKDNDTKYLTQHEIQKGEIERHNYYLNEIKRLEIIFIVCIIVLSAFLLYGFKMWYRRSQKHLDAVLKKESGLKEPVKIPKFKSKWLHWIIVEKQDEETNKK